MPLHLLQLLPNRRDGLGAVGSEFAARAVAALSWKFVISLPFSAARWRPLGLVVVEGELPEFHSGHDVGPAYGVYA